MTIQDDRSPRFGESAPALNSEPCRELIVRSATDTGLPFFFLEGAGAYQNSVPFGSD